MNERRCVRGFKQKTNPPFAICVYVYQELNTGKLTVGKIYGGLLILENWKTTRFGQIEPSASAVCCCHPYSFNHLISHLNFLNI